MENLTDDQIQQIRQVFDNIDEDGDGRISVEELGAGLNSVGIKMPGYQIREMVVHVDQDKDGFMNLEELKLLYLKESGRGYFRNLLKTVTNEREGGARLEAGSEISSGRAPHSTSLSETLAFSSWINTTLGDDPDCEDMIPVETESIALFEKCKNGIILCKLVNKSSAGRIDERAINMTDLSEARCKENLTLAINSAQAIGCSTVNIGPDDVAAGEHHLVLGLIWQIIRVGLLSDVSLVHEPGVAQLLEEGETTADLLKLSPEMILLRWVNHHLRKAGQPRRINNFSEDIKDSEAYTWLLKEIAPKDKGVDVSPMQESDLTKRADCMLTQANKIGCRSFVGPAVVVEGNAKLNLAFVANLFNNFPALEGVDETMDIKEETREEKTYRNWMNSLGVSPYVNHIYNDLTNGLVLFQLFDVCKPGLVDWKKVNKKFKQFQARIKKIENCNYVCELGKQMGLSLDGVKGEDIHNGNQTHVLALLWQMMRAYTISKLSDVPLESENAENAIVSWANKKLDEGTRFCGFDDSSLCDSVILVKLLEKLKADSVDWASVNQAAETQEEKLANAHYALSSAQKLGAQIYAMPEEIVEVNPNMTFTVFASLMSCDQA